MGGDNSMLQRKIISIFIMIWLVMNAAGAVRNTEERKNSRDARKTQRQNSKIRGKIREVKDNLGKNIRNKIKEVTEKPITKPNNRKVENNDENLKPDVATNWDYGQ